MDHLSGGVNACIRSTGSHHASRLLRYSFDRLFQLLLHSGPADLQLESTEGSAVVRYETAKLTGLSPRYASAYALYLFMFLSIVACLFYMMPKDMCLVAAEEIAHLFHQLDHHYLRSVAATGAKAQGTGVPARSVGIARSKLIEEVVNSFLMGKARER